MSDAAGIYSSVWGDRSGYVFLSIRDPNKERGAKGYWRDLVFDWPNDHAKLDATVRKARRLDKDVYWSPGVYREPRRSRDVILDPNALWADLDVVDPKALPKPLKPSIAWETSPGRWQALWFLNDTVKPQTHENLNQRLTYAVGADKGGWDLTQVLRLPGTPNHKYPDLPIVQLLWSNGHKLDLQQLKEDLPDIRTLTVDRTTIDEPPNQSFVLSHHKIPSRAKILIKARNAKVGTRSETLWELECLLAEAGLSAEEIVGVVRPTVWNKFTDRRDELRQLSTEARKAITHTRSLIAQVPDEPIASNGSAPETLEVVDEVTPLDWVTFDREHTAVRWMVAEIWGESEVGFISGLPKSYKSWIALDLGVSVATGTRFLNAFATRRHNVLLIQEEDPRPLIQERLAMVGGAKGLLGAEPNSDSTFDIWYGLPDNLYIISNQGFTINDEWLEQLEQWILQYDIKLVILDPLMMMGGENFDEFKAFDVMSKLLKPLKRLRADTQAAVVVVHHHTKASSQGGARDMYGSVALWAWEEAALHLTIMGTGKVQAERFSKHDLLVPLNIEIGEMSSTWAPKVSKTTTTSLYDVLSMMEDGATVEELSGFTGMSRDAVTRQLRSMKQDKQVIQSGTKQGATGRPSAVWRLIHE